MANAEYEHREEKPHPENPNLTVQEDGIITPSCLEFLRDGAILSNMDEGELQDIVKSHLRLWKKVGIYREATGLEQEGMS